MKLKNLFQKHIYVAEGLRLPVSRHFCYSTFGVRGRYANLAHTGNYICDDKPGTGFFARSSDSHSYSRHVYAARKKNEQSVWTLIFGLEPNFDKEYALVEKTLAQTDDPIKRKILSSYQNVISLAKEEEQLQRIVRAIKDRIGHHPKKNLVSVLSHYKSAIATLEHDVKSAQYNVSEDIPENRKEDWQCVVDAFHLLMQSRRIWSVYLEGTAEAYQQVFFDMGIFDYVQSPYDTPLMRDQDGLRYYIYPKGLIVARSSVDFDCYEWNSVKFEFRVVDISSLAVRPQFSSHTKHKHSHNHTDALNTLYGTTRAQVVGEISIPQLGKRFFFNHTGPAEDFVNALNKWIEK